MTTPDPAGLREALVDAMEAHEDGRRGGAYPHLGQTNDIRRFVDWVVDWMEKFTPAALATPAPLDEERLARAMEASRPGNCERCNADWHSTAEHNEIAPATPAPLDDHHGEPHEFRTTCLRCGKPGMLHVSLIAPEERVEVHPAARLAATEEGSGG